jgi:two-component system, LuxR family, response regulator FixJ
VRRSLTRLLRSAGITVREFSSARAFLDSSPAGSGCVILDLHMPDINGLELLEHLAESRPPLPVIVLSGNADLKAIQSAIAGGAAGFLVKPVEDELLFESIRSALGSSFAGKPE